jgi:hypothetical protein
MSIVLLGSTSGSCTLQEQAVAGTTVLTLPTTSGTVLTSASSVARSQLPAGSVLQVVSATYSTETSTTSTSYVATGLLASITPTSSSSKILIITTFPAFVTTGGLSGYYSLFRGVSNLLTADGAFRLETSAALLSAGSISYFDSPATTSSTTYQVYFKSQSSSLTTRICLSNATATITLMEIAA